MRLCVDGPAFAELGAEGFQSVSTAGQGDDVETLGGQQPGRRATDPAGSPRDQGSTTHPVRTAIGAVDRAGPRRRELHGVTGMAATERRSRAQCGEGCWYTMPGAALQTGITDCSSGAAVM